MKINVSPGMKLSLLLIFALLLCAAVLPTGSVPVSAQSDKSEKAKKPKSFGHKPEPLSIEPAVGRSSLTAPDKGKPFDIAVGFLRQNRHRFGLDESDLSELRVTDQYTSRHNGVTHIYLRQEIGGIEIVGADAATNVAHDGKLINFHSSFVRGLGRARRGGPTLSAVQAVEAAAKSLGLTITEPLEVVEAQGGPQNRMTFGTGGVSTDPIHAKLVYQPVDDTNVRVAWSVEIGELSGEHYWNLRVDAETGDVHLLAPYAPNCLR